MVGHGRDKHVLVQVAGIGLLEHKGLGIAALLPFSV